MSSTIGRSLLALLVSLICVAAISCGGGGSSTGGPPVSTLGFLLGTDVGGANPGVDILTIGSDGSVAPIASSPFTANGSRPQCVAASAATDMVFLGSGDLPANSSIAVFRIGANGTFTSLGPPVSSLVPFPLALSAAPAGNLLLVGSGNSNPAIFAVDTTTGVLTPLSGLGATGPATLAPDGIFIFSVDDSSLNSYLLNNQSGATTLVYSLFDFLPFGTIPNPPVVHSFRKFVYVPFLAQNVIPGPPPPGGIAGVAMATNGTLTAMPRQPFGSGINFGPAVIDPAGTHLYAIGGGDFVYGFNIDQNSGALSPIPAASPFGAGSPLALAFDPSGRYLFVAHNGGVFWAYSIGTDGTPTPAAGAPFFIGTEITSLAAIKP